MNILAGICDFTDLTIYEIADLGQICRGVFEGVTCPDYTQAKGYYSLIFWFKGHLNYELVSKLVMKMKSISFYCSKYQN